MTTGHARNIFLITIIPISIFCIETCQKRNNPIDSTGALRWTQRESGTSGDLIDVAWNGARFVAVGYDEILTSEDGIDWVQAQLPIDYPSGAGSPLKSVEWSGSLNLFLVAGGDNVVMTSSDGILWIMQESGVDWGLIKSAAAFDTLFLISYHNPAYFLTSPNGSEWTNHQDIGPFDDMASSDTLLIGVGNRCVYSTTNGADWTQRHCGDNLILFAVWFAEASTWVAAGHLEVFWRSIDGITWTSFDAGAGESSTLFDAISIGERCIVVGSANGPGLILESKDTKVWSKQIIDSTSWLRGIAASPNRFVVVGYSGVILTSP